MALAICPRLLGKPSEPPRVASALSSRVVQIKNRMTSQATNVAPKPKSAGACLCPSGATASSPGLPSPRGYPGNHVRTCSQPQRGCGAARTEETQPRWGWPPPTPFPQGSLADSATAGLEDGIPLGFAEASSRRQSLRRRARPDGAWPTHRTRRRGRLRYATWHATPLRFDLQLDFSRSYFRVRPIVVSQSVLPAHTAVGSTIETALEHERAAVSLRRSCSTSVGERR